MFNNFSKTVIVTRWVLSLLIIVTSFLWLKSNESSLRIFVPFVPGLMLILSALILPPLARRIDIVEKFWQHSGLIAGLSTILVVFTIGITFGPFGSVSDTVNLILMLGSILLCIGYPISLIKAIQRRQWPLSILFSVLCIPVGFIIYILFTDFPF